MIQLTTPISVGILDSNAYTHVKITKMTWDDEVKRIDLVARAGRVVNSKFVPGIETIATFKQHQIANYTMGPGPEHPEDPPTVVTDYDDLIAESLTSGADEPVYEEVANALYQWILDKELYAGTLV